MNNIDITKLTSISPGFTGDSITQQISPEDKKLLELRQKNLLRPREEIMGESIGNTSNTASIGSGPVNPNNVAASAIRARSEQKFNSDLNDIIQKQQYASYGKRAKNVATAFDESSQDYDKTLKRHEIQNRLRQQAGELNLDNIQLQMQEYLDVKYDKLQKDHNSISQYIFNENMRRKEIEAQNRILSTILGTAGTVGGALIGGAPGALAGGTIAAKAPDMVQSYDPMSAPRRGDY